MTFPRRNLVLTAACLATLTASAIFSQDPDLTYHTVTPCLVLDTRVAGGAFAANETRTYNIVGTASLASQGGSTTGCGIPGFSNNIPQAQAVAVNVVVITPGGAGHLQAYPADITTSTSVINYSSGVTVANTTHMALAQTSGVGDFKVRANVSTAHVLVSVVGYYSKAVQTVFVHPVPGNHPASGTRLINALAGITTASATKRYVVKIEPGIYDVGSTSLEMKPYVDLEGSGREATVIRGTGGEDFNYGVVKLASSAELRDLKVLCEGLQGTTAIGVLGANAHSGRITNVVIESSGGSATWGLRNIGSLNLVMRNSTITLASSAGSGDNYGIVNRNFASLTVERTEVTVSGRPNGYGVFSEDADLSLKDVSIDATGGTVAYGYYWNSQFGNGALTVSHSTIVAQGASSQAFGIRFGGSSPMKVEHSRIEASSTGLSYGVDCNSSVSCLIDHAEVAGDTASVTSGFGVNVGATQLRGGAASGATCSGVYDETYTFFASTCP